MDHKLIDSNRRFSKTNQKCFANFRQKENPVYGVACISNKNFPPFSGVF
jgi:hypothetical protein